MTNNCTLQHWTSNSRIEHAVADSATGPFVFADVAIPTWSHNAAPVALKDGRFAIFHIGDGTGPANGGANCGADEGPDNSGADGITERITKLGTELGAEQCKPDSGSDSIAEHGAHDACAE